MRQNECIVIAATRSSFIGLASSSYTFRWQEVITHVPCGGGGTSSPGELIISAELKSIDGVGEILGSAGPSGVWQSCPGISYSGQMQFDSSDISNMESDGSFEGVILHEMGHVIGVG